MTEAGAPSRRHDSTNSFSLPPTWATEDGGSTGSHFEAFEGPLCRKAGFLNPDEDDLEEEAADEEEEEEDDAFELFEDVVRLWCWKRPLL